MNTIINKRLTALDKRLERVEKEVADIKAALKHQDPIMAIGRLIEIKHATPNSTEIVCKKK